MPTLKKNIFACLVCLIIFSLGNTAKALPQTSGLPTPTQGKALPRGFEYLVKSFTLTYKDQSFTVDPKTLSSWRGQTVWSPYSPITWQPADLQSGLAAFFGLPSDSGNQVEPTVFHYQLDKIYGFIKTLAPTVTKEPVEPVLKIQGGRVTDFTPPQNGYQVDVYQTTLSVASVLEKNSSTTPLIVNETSPQGNLADTNSLGINELIAEGVSNFAGSPNNRRHNIAVGIEKFKGILVAPGATFSFDDNLGPVDGEHGFLPELVIKSTGTVPEFGGGLCQVSSTTFRAAMAAGLPITERKNHAYAVSYYAPQGTDATIYPGSADLKFINNTPATILIWPYEKDKNTLVFDFYGTKDSRQVTLEKPIQWDRKPDGSIKASWTRVVNLNGEISTSTFKSVYQPPALFHKTESFVSATGTPTTAAPAPSTQPAVQ